MSKLMKEIQDKARKTGKTIVLPEGKDERVVKAAIQIKNEGIAKIILIGDKAEIESNFGVDLTGIEVVNPATHSKSQQYIELLYELRKAKGMTMEAAADLVYNNPLYYGVLMVKSGDADGMVGGACHSTGDLLRPALQIIKTKKGISTVSSIFIICLPEGSPYGENGVFVFGDCGVMPCPNADELSDIAIASAASAKDICGMDPKVAMLSFSTKGSAKHESVTKVQEATAKVKERAPELAVDGELQLDAALVPEVAALKAKGSTVAGHANVLIFPDLNSGNIGYKLAQRLGNAEAIGPLCQGFALPVNDLSRGCNVQDIVDVVAVTCLQK